MIEPPHMEHPMARDAIELIGPQAASDDAFTSRHRFHQSWYRSFVLGLPYGTGPSESSSDPRGSMLRAGDAARGANFLTEEIRELADERIEQGGTVEPYRCRHNMLSSQPMCFNLFGPLTTRGWLAAQLVEHATARVVDPFSTRVQIEDSPGLLDDATGMDASIRYRTADGVGGILAIETKLTEKFSPKVYGLDHSTRYREVSTSPDVPFDQTRLEELTDSRWNQLWRNQMLAEAVKDYEGLDHAELLVVHPGGAEMTASIVDAYAQLLRRPSAVVRRSLSELVPVLRGAATGAEAGWLDAFHLRYVNLAASQKLYEAR